MKKILFLAVLSLFVVAGAFSTVLDYVPADSSMVFVMQNNDLNYDALKGAGIFGFLLRDMGLESMITQQFETMKYSDPTFNPDNLWALLKGDVALFASGDFDLSKLMNMSNMSKPESALSDPAGALGDLEGILDNVDLCAIIKPKASPDAVIETLNKALDTRFVFDVEEDGIYLAKDGEYILISNSRHAVDVAKNAKSNSILKNTEFASIYSPNHWFVFYAPENDNAKNISETLKASTDMNMEFIDLIDHDGKVEMKYSWAKGYIDGALVIESGNECNYLDQNFKSKVLSTVVDLKAKYETLKIPGFVNAALYINNLDWIWDHAMPVIDKLFETYISEDMKKEDFNLAISALKEWKGSLELGFDFSMTEMGDMVFDFLALLNMNDLNPLRDVFAKAGEKLGNSGNYEYSQVLNKSKGDDFDVYFMMGNGKAAISTIAPQNFDSKTASAPSLSKNKGFAPLAAKYSMGKGYGVLYADLGALLMKLLGFEYPSGIFAEMGLDANGNSRSIFVLK